MAVLLTNTMLGVRRRVPGVRNTHGERSPQGWGPIEGPYPGRTDEDAAATWHLGLDPRVWPVRQHDLVVSDSGASWLVDTANLHRNAYDPVVDWVEVTAQHRTGGHTEPGGPWYVARYADTVAVEPPVDTADLWTGHGPPPPLGAEFSPEVGDEYLDLDTGNIYRFDG